jgi:hypothetical protein
MPNNTILLTGDMGEFYDEGRCGPTSIGPGMMIEPITTTGKLKPHATAGGLTHKWFAIEDAFIGKTINDLYVSDDLVRYHKGRSGERLQVILKQGQTIVAGDKATSNGDGKMKKAGGADIVVGTFEDTLDLSAAAGDDWIKLQLA